MKTRKNLCFFAVTGEDGYHETKAEEELQQQEIKGKAYKPTEKTGCAWCTRI